jgi:flagellar motor switch/type III secretory pathway protein FliN
MRRTSLRRPSWPRCGSRVRFAPTAPLLLDELARRIAENAPDALRRRMDVAYAEPERGGYAPAPGGDRAWRVAEGETVAWCVVDLDSHGALLEAVLGGPGADRPTSIERAIVAETIERLFVRAGVPESQLAESERDRPRHEQWWRCNVDLTPRRGRSATLQLFAPPATVDRSNTLADGSCDAPDLHAVPMILSVEVAAISIALADILAWQPGAIVPLPRGSLGAATIAALPDVRLARGRIGSIADTTGCAARALQIASVHGVPAA